MDYTDPAYWPQLKSLAGRIDSLDYFQILNLAYDCSPAQVKTSYYQLARALTLTMPSVSISNVTSTFTVPRGAGRNPPNSNSPSS